MGCVVNISGCSLSIALSLVLVVFGLKILNIIESKVQREVQQANCTDQPFLFTVLLGGICSVIQRQSSMSLVAQGPSFISSPSFAFVFKLDNVLSVEHDIQVFHKLA